MTKPFSIHMVLGLLLLRSRLQPGQCKVLGPGVWVVGTVASVPAAVSSSNSTVYTPDSAHHALAVIFPARPHTCSVKESFMSYSGD